MDRLTRVVSFGLIEVSPGCSREPTSEHNIEITNVMPNRIYLAGQTFGKRKVIQDLPMKDGHSWCLCKCQCGREDIVQSMQLRFGSAHQCKECSGREKASARSPKHGHSSRESNSPTYNSWLSMHNRCKCESNPSFHNYGGRGIKVCKRWKDFRNFLEDMGERPKGTELDRYPNQNGNYDPSNCRWATLKQQHRNTRRNRLITAFGKTQCVAAWAEEFNQPYYRLLQRLNARWNPELAISKPSAK